MHVKSSSVTLYSTHNFYIGAHTGHAVQMNSLRNSEEGEYKRNDWLSIFLLYEIRYPIYPRSRVNHIETNNVMKIHVTETKEVKKTYLAFNSKFLIKENTRQLLLLESLLLHLYQYRWHLYSLLSAGYVPLCTCLNYTYPTIS